MIYQRHIPPQELIAAQLEMLMQNGRLRHDQYASGGSDCHGSDVLALHAVDHPAIVGGRLSDTVAYPLPADEQCPG